jgi:hypothetical protein
MEGGASLVSGIIRQGLDLLQAENFWLYTIQGTGYFDELYF